MSDEKDDWEVLDDEMKKAEERVETAKRKLAQAEDACIGPRAEVRAARLLVDALFFMRKAYEDGPDKASPPILNEPAGDSEALFTRQADSHEAARVPSSEERADQRDGSWPKALWGGGAPMPPDFTDEDAQAVFQRAASKEATQPEIPEGFEPWSGGECPVECDEWVDAIFRDGEQLTLRAGVWADDDPDMSNWHHGGTDKDIIAYRPSAPPGFTRWLGGQWSGSIHELVHIVRRNEHKQAGNAGQFLWGHGTERHSTDIIAYRIVEAPADQLRTTGQDVGEETIESSKKETENAL